MVKNSRNLKIENKWNQRESKIETQGNYYPKNLLNPFCYYHEINMPRLNAYLTSLGILNLLPNPAEYLFTVSNSLESYLECKRFGFTIS